MELFIMFVVGILTLFIVGFLINDIRRRSEWKIDEALERFRKQRFQSKHMRTSSDDFKEMEEIYQKFINSLDPDAVMSDEDQTRLHVLRSRNIL